MLTKLSEGVGDHPCFPTVFYNYDPYQNSYAVMEKGMENKGKLCHDANIGAAAVGEKARLGTK